MNIAEFEHIDLSTTLILASMATFGYVFGTLRQRRKAGNTEVLLRLQRDLSRARTAVNELGKVIGGLSDHTAKHHSRLKKLQNRIGKMGNGQGEVVWHELCQEVEEILAPTLQLVGEIANAQERIRYQSNHLMAFSEVRTDPLTGLGNRRALDCILSTQFALRKRYGTPFSLAVVDIDHFKSLNDQHGHLYGDQMLRDLADSLRGAMRTIDTVARYGGEEFVVVMPHTDIAGARTIGERLRLVVEKLMPFTVSVGIASASDTDTPESLFQRADAAMYRAKNSGRNRMFSECDETNDAVLQEAAEVEAAIELETALAT